jgi:hypothetical protein
LFSGKPLPTFLKNMSLSSIYREDGSRIFPETLVTFYRNALHLILWDINLLLPAHAGSSLADFSTLKMEAICSSETSVHFIGSTQLHIPEDGILH